MSSCLVNIFFGCSTGLGVSVFTTAGVGAGGFTSTGFGGCGFGGSGFGGCGFGGSGFGGSGFGGCGFGGSGFGGCGFGDGGRGAVFSSISFVATAIGFSFCSVAEQQIPTISAAWMIALIKMVNVLFNDWSISEEVFISAFPSPVFSSAFISFPTT